MIPQAAADPAREPVLRENRRREVLRLLRLILGRGASGQQDGAQEENPSRASEPAWDSMKHIELMFLLEDHFGVRLSATAMEQMEDVDGILRELDRNLEAGSRL